LKKREEKPSTSKSSIESILEEKSTKELSELAVQLFAKVANQEGGSPVSLEGSSSNKPIITSFSQPSKWY
jgi:hypothetical protein